MIMMLMLMVISEMHMMIFGVYTDSYSTTGEAFMRTFQQFSIGEELDLEHDYKNSPYGYIFLYLFSSVALLLVLSQFFIAILVAAWDSAAELKEIELTNDQLPPGFSARDDERPIWLKAAHWLVFCFTGYSIPAGTWSVRIKHAMDHLLTSTEYTLHTRRKQANAPYAPASMALTKAEENGLFMLDLGLVLGRETEKGLKNVGLSAKTVKHLMDTYVPPQELKQMSRAAHPSPLQRTQTSVSTDLVHTLRRHSLKQMPSETSLKFEESDQMAILAVESEERQDIASDVATTKDGVAQLKRALEEQRAAIAELTNMNKALLERLPPPPLARHGSSARHGSGNGGGCAKSPSAASEGVSSAPHLHRSRSGERTRTRRRTADSTSVTVTTTTDD